LTDSSETSAYELPVEGENPLVMDARPMIRQLIGDLDSGVPVSIASARFHNGFADATVEACARLATSGDLELVVLSGGVFQNRLLLQRTAAKLRDLGLRVLVPSRLPPNDGGISFGQAAVAAARLARGEN
jgi:hydrogenase maturation protein HypF